MTENRVRVRDYGVLSKNDPRQSPIPSIPGKRCTMHHLAADAFIRMARACAIQTGIILKAASGWRPHRWKDRAQYESYLVAHYGSVETGRRWVAYDSPHETGLAVDIGTGGLTPDSSTVQEQKKTLVYKWLVDHAHTFGFTPYLPEPWHWEFHISKADWEDLP